MARFFDTLFIASNGEPDAAIPFDGGEAKHVGSFRLNFLGSVRIDDLLHRTQGMAGTGEAGVPVPSAPVWRGLRPVGAAVPCGGADGASSAPLDRLRIGHVGRVFHDHDRVRLFDPSLDRWHPAAEPMAQVYPESGAGTPKNPIHLGS